MASLAIIRCALDRLHRQTGDTLTWLNRAVLVASLMGLMFIVALAPVFLLLRKPHVMLQTQAFEVNYAAGQRLNKRTMLQDPTWDGAISGMSMGYVFLKSVPVIGVAVGPLLGGIVGYTLDSRV